MIIKRSRLALLSMLCLAGIASHSPHLPGVPISASAIAAEEKLGPEVTSFFLDNGLQVVVIPDRRAPVVTHMLWYRAGAADEPPGKSGIAHFLEHLMFKGTPSNPDGAFSARIAEIGGEENAFTTPDYTAISNESPRNIWRK